MFVPIGRKKIEKTSQCFGTRDYLDLIIVVRHMFGKGRRTQCHNLRNDLWNISRKLLRRLISRISEQ